jgi:deoxyxylulose-5-phosphate synthase
MADAIADLHPSRQSPPVLTLGVPTTYIPHSKPDRILGQLGLDGPGIAASIFKAMEHGAMADAPRYLAEEDAASLG